MYLSFEFYIYLNMCWQLFNIGFMFLGNCNIEQNNLVEQFLHIN